MKSVFIKNMLGMLGYSNEHFSAKYRNDRLFDIKPLVYSYLNNDEIIDFLNSEMGKRGGEKVTDTDYKMETEAENRKYLSHAACSG